MGHFIETCKFCGAVISQCRCPSPDKIKRVGICSKCKESGVEGKDEQLPQDQR